MPTIVTLLGPLMNIWWLSHEGHYHYVITKTQYKKVRATVYELFHSVEHKNILSAAKKPSQLQISHAILGSISSTW